MDIDKLLENGIIIQPSTIAKWCQEDPIRLEMLAGDIYQQKGRGIFSYTTKRTHPHDMIKDNILNGCAKITHEEFKTWYYNRWKPEKKSAVFMSEALRMAIQCNKDLYGDGIPADAVSTTSENKRIKKWLEVNWPEAPAGIDNHMKLIVKPTTEQIKDSKK